jgi:hypothetical protein
LPLVRAEPSKLAPSFSSSSASGWKRISSGISAAPRIVLGERLGGRRLRFTDDQRYAWSSRAGQSTVAGWASSQVWSRPTRSCACAINNRELIARKYDGSGLSWDARRCRRSQEWV